MSRPTPELKAAIVADRKAGMTVTDAARKYGVSETSVKRWCSEARVASGQQVKKPKKARSYTAEQRQQMLEDHYFSGRTVTASSTALGIAYKTLAAWVRADRSWIEEEPIDDLAEGRWALCEGCRVQVHTAYDHECSRRVA